MEKTCLNCKFEPDWKEYKQVFNSYNSLMAGKCKFPIPSTLTPMVGMDGFSTNVKDSDGKYFVDMDSGSICYAWEAKE